MAVSTTRDVPITRTRPRNLSLSSADTSDIIHHSTGSISDPTQHTLDDIIQLILHAIETEQMTSVNHTDSVTHMSPISHPAPLVTNPTSHGGSNEDMFPAAIEELSNQTPDERVTPPSSIVTPTTDDETLVPGTVLPCMVHEVGRNDNGRDRYHL